MIKMYRHAATMAACIAALSLAGAEVRAESLMDGAWPSNDGLYQLGIESRLDPITINRLHRWVLTLTDAAGNPVEGATIDVDGGMPAHNHGLPTAPRVTRYLGDGRYLLEGMRFHMQGEWELSFVIEAAPGTDTVYLSFGI